jgi:hypothetical protein
VPMRRGLFACDRLFVITVNCIDARRRYLLGIAALARSCAIDNLADRDETCFAG